MRLNIIAYSLAAMLFVSCSKRENNTKTVEAFPESATIRCSNKMAIDSVLLSYPVMKVDGDYCCIADMGARSEFFYIFRYPSMKFLKSFGTLGNASNEIAGLTAFDFKDGRVSALCHTDRSNKIFDIDNPSIPQVIRIRHDQDYYTVCDGRDSTYYLYAMNGDNRIVRVGFDGTVISEGLKSETLKKEYPTMTSNYIWQSFIRKKGDKIVVSCVAGDVIDITDSSFASNIRVVGKLGLPHVEEKVTNAYTSYMLHYHTYSDMVLGDNMYALFKSYDMVNYPKGEHLNSVRVFDYDGNPVKELIMEDNLEATSFHVDEHRKKMYVAVSDSEKQIWEYEL